MSKRVPTVKKELNSQKEIHENATNNNATTETVSPLIADNVAIRTRELAGNDLVIK